MLREKGGRFLSDDMTVLDEDATAHVLPEAADDQRAHAARRRPRRPQPRGVGHPQCQEPDPLQGRALGRTGHRLAQPADHVGQLRHPDAGATAEVPRRPAGPLRARPTRSQSASCSSSSGAPRTSARSAPRTPCPSCWTTPTTPTDSRPSGTSPRPWSSAGRSTTPLRARESEILRSALEHIRIRRLASNSFSWADEIPELLQRDSAATADERSRRGGVSSDRPGHRADREC